MRERYTGKSRGFGFITFAAAADAYAAVASEHHIDGRKCEAKFALPEGKVGSARTTRIFVARIPSSVTDQQFRCYFEQWGVVQDAYMPKDPSKQGHRGIGFVTYSTPEAVERVMQVAGGRGWVVWVGGWELAGCVVRVGRWGEWELPHRLW